MSGLITARLKAGCPIQSRSVRLSGVKPRVSGSGASIFNCLLFHCRFHSTLNDRDVNCAPSRKNTRKSGTTRGKIPSRLKGGLPVMTFAVSLPHSIAKNAIEWGTLDFVCGPPAQGVKWSMKHVAKDASTIGRWAGRAGKVYAAYSAYQRYQKCRGD